MAEADIYDGKQRFEHCIKLDLLAPRVIEKNGETPLCRGLHTLSVPSAAIRPI